ncbi:unnamed protein product, partial [Cladocopium goreaui]
PALDLFALAQRSRHPEFENAPKWQWVLGKLFQGRRLRDFFKAGLGFGVLSATEAGAEDLHLALQLNLWRRRRLQGEESPLQGAWIQDLTILHSRRSTVHHQPRGAIAVAAQPRRFVAWSAYVCMGFVLRTPSWANGYETSMSRRFLVAVFTGSA